jgi:hypothetical protein
MRHDVRMTPRTVLVAAAACTLVVSGCGGGGEPGAGDTAAVEDGGSGDVAGLLDRLEPPAALGDDTTSPFTVGGQPMDAEMSELIAATVDDLVAQAAPVSGSDESADGGVVVVPAAFRSLPAAPAAGAGGSLAGLGYATVAIGDVAGGTAVQARSSSNLNGGSATGRLDGGIATGTDASGSRTVSIDMTVEATTSAGASGSVTVKGKVTGPPCPGEDGVIEMHFEGTVEARVSGASVRQGRVSFSGTATLTFGDDGELANVDVDEDIQANRTDADGTKVFIEMSSGYVQDVGGGGAPSVKEAQVVRSSQQATGGQADLDMMTDAVRRTREFTRGAVEARRAFVTGGGCVTVDVSGPTSVGPAVEVQVQVSATHELEGTALDQRAAASLGGKGELATTTLDSTPGTLNYVSGDQQGDRGTITVTTRSRRGIGSGELTVEVRPSYRIESPDSGLLVFTGVVCALDKPFTVTVGGQLPGSLTFTPASADGGSYAGSGDVGRGSIRWSGGYTVQGADSERPTVKMDEGTTTLEGPMSMDVPSFWAGGVTLNLIPDPAACP